MQPFYGQQILTRSAGEPLPRAASQAATIALLSTSPAARIVCFDWKNDAGSLATSNLRERRGRRP